MATHTVDVDSLKQQRLRNLAGVLRSFETIMTITTRWLENENELSTQQSSLVIAIDKAMDGSVEIWTKLAKTVTEIEIENGQLD